VDEIAAAADGGAPASADDDDDDDAASPVCVKFGDLSGVDVVAANAAVDDDAVDVIEDLSGVDVVVNAAPTVETVTVDVDVHAANAAVSDVAGSGSSR
jgi:hypothetical protein